MIKATNPSQKKKKHPRSMFYRISAWLHLWLGLISGIVIVIVSLTGVILTFEQELRVWLQPYQTVNSNNRPILPPSVLSKKVMKEFKFPSVAGVYYQGENRSTIVPYYADPKRYTIVYIDPYSGKVLHSQLLDKDFYRIMLTGHYQLWLPRPIGQPIVAYSTLIFVVTLISGIVLWWPKKWTKTTAKASFFIKVKAKFKRINYDLHNVLGFYSLLIALILGLTGMVYGMRWFEKAVYFAGSGEAKHKNVSRDAVSDTTLTTIHSIPEEDILYRRLVVKGVDVKHQLISIGYPRGKKGTWGIGINPKPGTYYLDHYQYYEQHSLKLLSSQDTYAKSNGGEKLSRLNLDLHIGSIGGIWTKIIVFFACLISTSLPITGFIIWIKKKNKCTF